jgi:DNA-binding CsgD family transcriptional regulator
VDQQVVDRAGGTRLLVPLVGLCLVVGLVAAGFAQGFWLDNLHNGLLALAFSFVGATTLFGRPWHREGLLLLLTGLAQGVLFVGRQVEHFSTGPADAWWGWAGVWPLALTLGLVSWCVLCFPEGRFLSQSWTTVGVVVAIACVVLSLVSALWPVEFEAAGVTTSPPFTLPGRDSAQRVWEPVAHPVYAVLQAIWVVAVIARWRHSDAVARRQLLVVVLAVAASLVGVVVSLLVTHSPQPGLLVTPVIPLACGYALERLSLGKVIEREAQAGHLAGLSPREQEVLDLMSQGLSNAAISQRLHLSIKTVEPIVGSIFRKMAMPDDSDTNRRVLAVVRYLSS